MTIKYGTPDELGLGRGSISKFFRDFWPKKTPLADEILYDYLYRLPTEDDVSSEASTVALDTYSGAIVAAMAARARTFFLPDGQRLRGVEMSTWLVNPDHQSSGIGVKVLTRLLHSYDFCLGASITDEARDIYLRLGFSWQPALLRFVFAPEWKLLDEFVRDAHLAHRVAKARNTSLVTNVKIEYVDFSDQSNFDKAPLAASFDRRFPALKWRFQQNPFFTYYAVRIFSEKQSITVIFRSECLGSFQILRVVDVIGPLSAFPIVPAGLELLCSDQSAVAVDFFCSHVTARDAFASAGWFVLPDDECVMNFPHLLTPPSPRSPNSFSIVSWLNPMYRTSMLMSELFVTKQDCDMDRLSSSPYG